MKTDGSTPLTITGVGLGSPGTTATLQWNSGTYSTSQCTIGATSSTASCTESAPGISTSATYSFRIISDLGSSPFAGSLAYCAPTITQASGPATLATTGFETITIEGQNFGLGSNLVVTWRPPSYTSIVGTLICTIAAQHTRITCTTPALTGKSMSISLGVGVLSTTYGSSLSYATPNVQSILPSTGLATVGGTSLTFTGSSFGPSTIASSAISVTIGPSPSKVLSGCIIVSDTRITCTSAAVVGTNLPIATFTIGGVVATGISSLSISYAAPAITSISNSVATSGGTLTLVGTNFGMYFTATCLSFDHSIVVAYRLSTINRAHCFKYTMDHNDNSNNGSIVTIYTSIINRM
jgi:hypothetical protein